MKRIKEYRELFDVKHDTDLKKLKSTYRNLVKEWHPDKFQDGDALKATAEIKSKSIIDGYHFLVSISPETHALNAEEYAATTNNSGIDDFQYKGLTLRISFQDGSEYEYFGVQKNMYNKLINSPTPARFARRHICHSHVFRKVAKAMVEN